MVHIFACDVIRPTACVILWFRLAAANHATTDDEWDAINRMRDYILTQIDGAEILPLLHDPSLLTAEQRSMILNDPVRERRTQSLLDILEMKPIGAYRAFVDAIGELYPHVYLELTGANDNDDGKQSHDNCLRG
jgi:hypothetical protein